MDEAFLLGQKVGPYSEMPLWVPEEYHAFETVSCARAVAAGLRYRPLAETIRDTLAWARTLPGGPRTSKTLGVEIPAAMSREREREVLDAWRRRAASAGGDAEAMAAGPGQGAVR
jgi:2'-hydroxyisoflavone reductase